MVEKSTDPSLKRFQLLAVDRIRQASIVVRRARSLRGHRYCPYLWAGREHRPARYVPHRDLLAQPMQCIEQRWHRRHTPAIARSHLARPGKVSFHGTFIRCRSTQRSHSCQKFAQRRSPPPRMPRRSAPWLCSTRHRTVVGDHTGPQRGIASGQTLQGLREHAQSGTRSPSFIHLAGQNRPSPLLSWLLQERPVIAGTIRPEKRLTISSATSTDNADDMVKADDTDAASGGVANHAHRLYWPQAS